MLWLCSYDNQTVFLEIFDIHVYCTYTPRQCSPQTAPLWEHCVTIRDDPQKTQRGQFSPLLLQGWWLNTGVLFEKQFQDSVIQCKKRSQSNHLLDCIDSLTLENFQMADQALNCPIMYCKPLITDYIMYS